MHLISALASGCRGGENGSVDLLRRGTSTAATYYADFEATQQLPGTAVPLDSNGRLIAYVSELVDVKVHDSLGVFVCDFVAGVEDAAVEVISPSFTGIDYSSGASGVQKPTTLSNVLDSWVTSAGAIDWKVAVNGVATTLSVALSGLAGLFFNVKGFGALGNGSSDDSLAIQAAVSAAAVLGGIVYFPPGTYRTSTKISIPAGVSLLGNGGASSKLAIDDPAALVGVVDFAGSDAGIRSVRGMWFGAIGHVNGALGLMTVSGAGARVIVEECLFGNDAFWKGVMVTTSHSTLDAFVGFTGCAFYNAADANILSQTGAPAGRITLRDCDFKGTLVGTVNNAQLNILDGVLVDGCRFDNNAATGGTMDYISYGQPNGFGGCVFVSNRFKGGLAVRSALRNNQATPATACWDSSNSFGDLFSGSIAGYSDVTDGYAPVTADIAGLRSRISREQRSLGFATNAATVTVDPKNFGLIVLQRTVNSAQTINATMGTLGDRLQFVLLNNSGGNIAPTFGTNFAPRGGLAVIPNNTRGCFNFVWLPSSIGGATGIWVQISTESYL